MEPRTERQGCLAQETAEDDIRRERGSHRGGGKWNRCRKRAGDDGDRMVPDGRSQIRKRGAARSKGGQAHATERGKAWTGRHRDTIAACVRVRSRCRAVGSLIEYVCRAVGRYAADHDRAADLACKGELGRQKQDHRQCGTSGAPMQEWQHSVNCCLKRAKKQPRNVTSTSWLRKGRPGGTPYRPSVCCGPGPSRSCRASG